MKCRKNVAYVVQFSAYEAYFKHVHNMPRFSSFEQVQWERRKHRINVDKTKRAYIMRDERDQNVSNERSLSVDYAYYVYFACTTFTSFALRSLRFAFAFKRK